MLKLIVVLPCHLSATCRNIFGLWSCAFSNVYETIGRAISTLNAIVDEAIWTWNLFVDETSVYEATLSATNAISCANGSGKNGIFYEILDRDGKVR